MTAAGYNYPLLREPIMSEIYGQSGPSDQAMALALITVWATRTGRTLRPVPVDELSVDELMAFWVDDQIEADLEVHDRLHERGCVGRSAPA